MEKEEDKKHKRIGWITSISTQVVLLVLFYFLVAWKEPFPPIPSYGIELSFGFEDQGAGTQPVSNPDPVEEIQEIEESLEESDDQSEEAPTEDPVEEEVMPEAETPVTEKPSPDVVKTEKSEPVKQPKEEPVKKAEEEKPKLNPEATMPTASKSDETNESKGTTDKKGNEGKEEGTIDGRALMGQPGAANGANLNMAGWMWDSKPNPKDDSSESGKIVYKVTIDESGYVKGLELISSTVSPTVERYYRQSIEKITFSQTTNTPAPPTSTGTITFIIKAK